MLVGKTEWDIYSMNEHKMWYNILNKNEEQLFMINVVLMYYAEILYIKESLTVVRLWQVALLVVRLTQVRVRQVCQVRDVRVCQRVGQPPGVPAASALRGRRGGGGGTQVGGA